MKFALALLCIGAVAFLLRVLAALLRDGMSSSTPERIHFAKSSSSRRGELIEMNVEPKTIVNGRRERKVI